MDDKGGLDNLFNGDNDITIGQNNRISIETLVQVKLATRMIYLGLSQKKQISEYQHLYQKYILESLELQPILLAIAEQLDLKILHIDSQGIILQPIENSIFQPKAADIDLPKSTLDKKIVLLFLILVASYCYPNIQVLEDVSKSGKSFDIDDLLIYIEDVIAKIEEDKTLFEKAGAIDDPSLSKLFHQVKEIKPSFAKENERSSRTAILKQIISYLEIHGFMKEHEGRYYPLAKFKYNMYEMIGDSYFKQIMEGEYA